MHSIDTIIRKNRDAAIREAAHAFADDDSRLRARTIERENPDLDVAEVDRVIREEE